MRPGSAPPQVQVQSFTVQRAVASAAATVPRAAFGSATVPKLSTPQVGARHRQHAIGHVPDMRQKSSLGGGGEAPQVRSQLG